MTKILIDATGITRQKAGVGVYAKNLLNNLTKSSADVEFYILAQNDDPEMDFGARNRVKMLWVPARLFRLFPLRFLMEQVYLPWVLWTRGIDVVHSLHYAFPLCPVGARRVVTLHDMTFFTMAEVHEKVKVIYFRFFMRAAVRFADAIIFISQSVQRDCVELLGNPAGIQMVIPHGKDELLKPSSEETGWSRGKFGIPSRFVLYVGTLEPRKNLERLLTAFVEIAAQDKTMALVLAGKMGWMMDSLGGVIDRLGLKSQVIFTGFISDPEKADLLSSCAVFVYPSLYEGFGLPVLEALACGAPTITSNISSLPEVAGDAAILINPLEIAELATAIKSVLSNAVLSDDLRSRGPAQANKFSWPRAAAMTAEAYRSVISIR